MKRHWLISVVCFLVGFALASDELTLTSGWTYNKNSRKRVVAPTATQYDIAGNYVIENVQLISTNTAGDQLYIGGVTTAGFAYFHNGDLTNYVEIGLWDSTGTNLLVFLKLLAGEYSTVWLGNTQVVERANTDSVKLDYVMSDR